MSLISSYIRLSLPHKHCHGTKLNLKHYINIITVTHPLQAANVARAATVSGHAAAEAYACKMRLGAEECRRQGISFIPLAPESLGGWHEVGEKEVRKLGSALARQTGQVEEVAISRLFQKLSILLMKGNCALINNREPGLAHSNVDGIL